MDVIVPRCRAHAPVVRAHPSRFGHEAALVLRNWSVATFSGKVGGRGHGIGGDERRFVGVGWGDEVLGFGGVHEEGVAGVQGREGVEVAVKFFYQG